MTDSFVPASAPFAAHHAPPRLSSGALLLTGLLACLFLLRNPLIYAMAPGFDASLFAVMGTMWQSGDVLYRDMIDIKGPLIFAFDALGAQLGEGVTLGPWRGIWLLEWLLAWAGLACSWQALAWLKVSQVARAAALSALLALYGLRYYYGNMTEDWTFHLALIGQWAFIRLLLSPRFHWAAAAVAALTFALVVWMRTNNGALWGGWYLALFVTWLLTRSRDAGKLLASALLGLTAVAAPLYAYFAQHGVLDSALYYAFGIFFDGAYGSGLSLSDKLCVGLVGLFRTGLILPLLGALALLLSARRPSDGPAWQPVTAAALMLGCMFSVIANSVSGHVFDHYDVLFLPLAVVPLALVIDRARAQADRAGLACLALLLLLTAWLLAQQ
ncbi:MAG: hypothetical protein ACRCYV_00210, partial [Aeromonas sp.]